jgi:hypothetical protein
VKEALRKELASMPTHASFNHAFANPPYFEDGKTTPSPNLLKAQAHAFGPGDLELWVKVLHTMLSPRGTVTLVHRAETLGKLLSFMEEKFGDIRIAPLYAREGTAASRVIVQGVKGSKAPMQLLPGLVLHDANSQFTALTSRCRVDHSLDLDDAVGRKSGNLGMPVDRRLVLREIDAERLVARDIGLDPLNVLADLGECRVGFRGGSAQLILIQIADAGNRAFDDEFVHGFSPSVVWFRTHAASWPRQRR